MRIKVPNRWKVLGILLIIAAVVLYNAAFILTFSTNVACNIGLEWKRHFTETTYSTTASGNADITNLWNMKIAMSDLEVYDETLIVTDRNCNEVVAFDWHSGQTIWTRRFGGPNELELNTFLNQIYITGGWSWRRELMAIDVETGKKVWLNNSQNFKRIGINVEVLPDGRVLVDIGDQELRVVDQNTGKFGDVLATSYHPFRRTGDLVWTWDSLGLHAIDLFDQHSVWDSNQVELPGSRLSTIDYDTNIVVAAITIVNADAPWTSPQELLGFDFYDGTLLWEVSNLPPGLKFRIDGAFTYMVDGPMLLILDSSTGDDVGQIAFTPVDKTGNSELEISSFRVQGDKLAIYFANTQILSIYEIES